MLQPSIFISYAHQDAELAGRLAAEMQLLGARVWIDQGELLVGDSLVERISDAIAEFDFVAALVSTASVSSNWCRREIALGMTKQLQKGARRVSVLPVRVDNVEMPPALRDLKWVELESGREAAAATTIFGDARRHLNRAQYPKAPTAMSTADASQGGPIRLVMVDTEGVSAPRGDGTRGSALYRVPVILSRVPHPYWAANFQYVWDRPPAFTLMHRPGIASVQGDRVILDGTTIEEFEKYHLQTLKLVVTQLNDMTAAHLETEQVKVEARREAEHLHRQRIEEANKRLNFD